MIGADKTSNHFNNEPVPQPIASRFVPWNSSREQRVKSYFCNVLFQGKLQGIYKSKSYVAIDLDFRLS